MFERWGLAISPVNSVQTQQVVATGELLCPRASGGGLVFSTPLPSFDLAASGFAACPLPVNSSLIHFAMKGDFEVSRQAPGFRSVPGATPAGGFGHLAWWGLKHNYLSFLHGPPTGRR